MPWRLLGKGERGGQQRAAAGLVENVTQAFDGEAQIAEVVIEAVAVLVGSDPTDEPDELCEGALEASVHFV